MNFQYASKSYAINCDWLQFSVHLANPDAFELLCPEGYRLEVLPGNNCFRNRAILWRLRDGAKFFTILWGPYSRKIDKRIMTCQIGNLLLYCGGIHEAYRLLCECCECNFNSMGRIDICCDFEVGKYELMFIRNLWTNDYYVTRKSEGSDFWHATDSVGSRFVHCMSWGSKSSEIKVKLYNKSREIAYRDGVSEKPWIVNEWKFANLNPSCVWRLEFSMAGSGQLLWKGKRISIDDVTSSVWLCDVFLSLYSRRFVCRQSMGLVYGHKNEDPRVNLLSLPKSVEKLQWKPSDKDEVVTTAQIAMLRRLVASLDYDLMKVDLEIFEHVGRAILKVCEGKGVTSYFRHAYGGLEPYEYLCNYAENVGGGIVDAIPSLRDVN